MQVPAILQGDSLTRLLKGAAMGAVATLFMGWHRKGDGTTECTTALVTALAPICVDKFQRSADAATNMTELKKTSSWQQSSFIEKGGRATFSGSDQASALVADACATLLAICKTKPHWLRKNAVPTVRLP
jgi:hypothetical protein